MKRDLKVYLNDIVESLELIEKCQDQQLQDSVNRRLEIIGEAVKQVDANFRSRYPAVPWQKIAGLRDVLIHEYFGINPLRVWAALKADLPILKKDIETIITAN